MGENLPLKILQEAKPFVVTIETKNGQRYRGRLVDVETNMNCSLENVVIIDSNGLSRKLDNLFIRGSNLRLLILPDLLRESPLFGKI